MSPPQRQQPTRHPLLQPLRLQPPPRHPSLKQHKVEAVGEFRRSTFGMEIVMQLTRRWALVPRPKLGRVDLHQEYQQRLWSGQVQDSHPNLFQKRKSVSLSVVVLKRGTEIWYGTALSSFTLAPARSQRWRWWWCERLHTLRFVPFSNVKW